jgi:hypothetical protein
MSPHEVEMVTYSPDKTLEIEAQCLEILNGDDQLLQKYDKEVNKIIQIVITNNHIHLGNRASTKVKIRNICKCC